MRHHASAPRKLRLPLTLCLALLLIGVVLAVGAALGTYNYTHASRIVLSAADALLADTGREVALELERDVAPANLLVEFVATQPVTRASTLDARMRELPALARALNENRAISAVYVGYANGDFFLVRALRDPGLRRDLGAPTDASFVVQSVEHGSAAGPLRRFLYLRDDLTTIGASERPDFDFDPRTRGWYRAALVSRDPVRIGPYAFFTTREPGLTFAHRDVDGGSVVGADITLASLSRLLARQRVTPSSALFLVGDDGRVVARNDTPASASVDASRTAVRLESLADLPLAAAAPLAHHLASESAEHRFEFATADRAWIGSIERTADNAIGAPLYLAVASPVDELLEGANRMRNQSIIVTLAMVGAAIPLAWLLASGISRPLRRLATGAAQIQALNFDETPPVHSIVREIDRLESVIRTSRTSVRRFLEIASALAAERRVDRLIERVLAETMHLAHADAAAIHLVDARRHALESAQYVCEGIDEPISLPPVPLTPASSDAPPIVRAVLEGRTVLVDLGLANDADRAWLGAEAERFHGRALSFLAIPLHDRQGDVIGVLSLVSARVAAAGVRPQLVSFIEKLSGVAAVALETQQLVADQKALLESFIELVAAAIDAKSPYTGGHCQRVPALTKMLAQAACDARDGPFGTFRLSDDEWEAVHIASWLHDCGKVTTPEYVVDKATKLETLYDRIHEVRMRFEVLKRDAEIAYWKGRCAGGSEAALREELADAWRTLDDDFGFVARCNEGGEAMARESAEHILRIAKRTWQRTLDDRIGLSWEERARRERQPARDLPVTEPLLGDAPHHVIERTPGERMPDDNRWGFRLDVPQHRYDRGEIHNLLVGRGTLTDEERYVINHHIVQTIVMLDKLPFPRHLAQVPEIAGGHHERMDGRGYPRRLTRAQMSPVARMIAIADIFEALTAVDRPYKKGKTLSESIAIMARMRDEQHIDADLFELFLASGVYRRYAERYLEPAQIDDVDVRAFARPAYA